MMSVTREMTGKTCWFVIKHNTNKHFFNYQGSVLLNFSLHTTRDGTSSLSLTPNCRWSELCLADTEWRLDKRNHPDSLGWSGRWLAAARVPQLGLQHLMPSGVKLATGHHWLDHSGMIGAGLWGAGLVKGAGWWGQVLWGQGHVSKKGMGWGRY